MKEASLVKYYFARYFFLALALLQVMAGMLIMVQLNDSPKSRFSIFVFFTFAMILTSIHLIIFNKVKRVAISKKKIKVISSHKEKQYDWDEVKELKLLAFVNMYSLKLKSKKSRIYFLPTGNQGSLPGLFPQSTEFVRSK